MACLTSAAYPMKFKAAAQSTITNSRTGEIKRSWVADSEYTACRAESVVGKGIGNVGSAEFFKEDYRDRDWLRLYTKRKLNKRMRIVEIVDADNTVIWTEPDDTTMVFNVNGVMPVADGFGKILEYDIFIERVESQ